MKHLFHNSLHKGGKTLSSFKQIIFSAYGIPAITDRRSLISDCFGFSYNFLIESQIDIPYFFDLAKFLNDRLVITITHHPVMPNPMIHYFLVDLCNRRSMPNFDRIAREFHSAAHCLPPNRRNPEFIAMPDKIKQSNFSRECGKQTTATSLCQTHGRNVYFSVRNRKTGRSTMGIKYRIITLIK